MFVCYAILPRCFSFQAPNFQGLIYDHTDDSCLSFLLEIYPIYPFYEQLYYP